MPLSTPNLDDLRFQQDLVDEARRRIIRYCPEWTDYNVSDPGITLIELFAWMTEMLVYRLNRVPDKNYIKFLELLGIQLQPASSATTDLTFRLSAPFPLGPEDDTEAVVPRGTEVATRRTEQDDEIIFTTDERLVISPPALVHLRRDDEVTKNYLPRLNVEPFYAFTQRRPQEGDTFYIGFDEEDELGGHILRLLFSAQERQATGIKREDPPLVWECSLGDGRWQEIRPSTRVGEKDSTGGLNNESGQIVFYLPLDAEPDTVHGRHAYWIRCRLEQRRKEQGMYTESPRITGLSAQVLGGTVPATHAVFVSEEMLGTSTGDPGQTFHLDNTPVLALQEGEHVLVEEKRDGDLVFVPWERVDDFSNSTRYDRHFTLDTATGEIRFGPSVRQPDGTVRQYGRVPEAGRRVRFSTYRYGGGAVGNVPAGKIRILRTSIPYIDQVTNLDRAEGGRDQENLEEAMLRARRQIHAQERAVTAEDYENLALRASRSVARAKCNAPSADSSALPPGMIELLVVPEATTSLRAGDRSKLALSPQLRETVTCYLDDYRLLTTTLHVREPIYLGVKAHAEVVVAEQHLPERVQSAVADRLSLFLSPLCLGDTGESDAGPLLGPDWNGWPFGRDLYVSELYSLIQDVPGVKHVLDVTLSYREVIPREEVPAPVETDDDDDEESDEPLAIESTLTPVEGRVLTVPADAVLCSLDHTVEVVAL